MITLHILARANSPKPPSNTEKKKATIGRIWMAEKNIDFETQMLQNTSSLMFKFYLFFARFAY